MPQLIFVDDNPTKSSFLFFHCGGFEDAALAWYSLAFPTGLGMPWTKSS